MTSSAKLLLTVLLLVSLVPLVGGFYQTQVVGFGLIDVQLALGLSLVSGYAGQISLGQAGFFAIGAYTAAMTATRLGWPMGAGAAAAVLVTAAAGLIVGLPSLRVRGLYLAMVTLMFSFIVETLATHLVGITGGVQGIGGIERPVLGRLGPLSNIGYFYFLVVVTTVLTLGCLILVRSPIGWKFVAIRDDESAAQMLGIPIYPYKLFAFLLSASLAGLAGVLYAHYLGFISPEVFPGSLSITLLMMIIIGGMRRIDGAVLGALIVGVLPEVLRVARSFWNLVFGALLVLIIIALPDGLISLPARLRRSRREAAGRLSTREAVRPE